MSERTEYANGEFCWVGLISPEQVNLAGSGLIAYKQFSSDEAPKLRAQAKRGLRLPKAEAALGPKFDIRDFHAQVLMTGSLPLTILEQKIDKWIAEKKAS